MGTLVLVGVSKAVTVTDAVKVGVSEAAAVLVGNAEGVSDPDWILVPLTADGFDGGGEAGNGEEQAVKSNVKATQGKKRMWVSTGNLGQ